MRSAAWLAASGADGLEKAENACFLGFQTSIWYFSRFETFLKKAFDARSAAWLAARWTDGIEKAEKVGKMLVFLRFQG